jgi:hypothetical protein
MVAREACVRTIDSDPIGRFSALEIVSLNKGLASVRRMLRV